MRLAVCYLLFGLVFTIALHAHTLHLGDVPTFPDVVPLPLDETCMRYLSGCKAKNNYTDDTGKQYQQLKSCMLKNGCPRLSQDFLNKAVHMLQKNRTIKTALSRSNESSSAFIIEPWYSLVIFPLTPLVIAAGVWS